MTSSVEMEIVDIERRVSAVAEDVGECVAVLRTPGELPRFVVAERLVPLGSALVPHLLKILSDPEADDDLRGCAAFLGFTVGDREACAMELLDQIEMDGSWAQSAAMKLSQAGYPGVVSAIESALRRASPIAVDATVGYLRSLRAAGGPLPLDLRERLSASEYWQVSSAVGELFPDT